MEEIETSSFFFIKMLLMIHFNIFFFIAFQLSALSISDLLKSKRYFFLLFLQFSILSNFFCNFLHCFRQIHYRLANSIFQTAHTLFFVFYFTIRFKVYISEKSRQKNRKDEKKTTLLVSYTFIILRFFSGFFFSIVFFHFLCFRVSGFNLF